MEQAHNVVNGLFDNLISALTGGVIQDVQTAMMGVGGLILIIFAIDVIGRIINGVAPSAQVSEWWGASGDDLDYQSYKKRRQRKEDFADRYQAEKIGKHDAEAGMAYLQKKRGDRS